MFSEPTNGKAGARYRFFSDNDRKYYSIEHAREVLGYEPQDNSAHWTFEGEPKEGT